MSSIAGILTFDGALAEREDLLRLEVAMERLAPDGFHRHIDGVAALTFGAFHTTKSQSDVQPLIRGHLRIVLDGRIDNARDLGPRGGGASDAEVCLASFERRGCDAFSEWIGDFATAIWNDQSRELVLARDPFGVRPLYYHADRRRVIWSSSIEALLEHPSVPDDLSPEYLHQYMVADPARFRTPFRSIAAVPPGHHVRFFQGAISTARFWSVARNRQRLAFRTDAEWEEAFRHHFLRSIRNCLRSDMAVTAQLSGGIDSSAIVCAADHLASRGEVPDKVETISFIFDRHRRADEREYITVVERHRNKAGTHLREDDAPILSFWPNDQTLSYPCPILCFGGRIQQVLGAMSSRGSRILLSGWGGDQLCMNEGSHLEIADLIARGHLLQAWHSSASHAQAEGSGTVHLMRDAFRSALQSNVAGEFITRAPWIRQSASFSAATHELQAVHKQSVCGARLPSKRQASAGDRVYCRPYRRRLRGVSVR